MSPKKNPNWDPDDEENHPYYLPMTTFADVWDEALQLAYDLGWMHDKALSDTQERNPYR